MSSRPEVFPGEFRDMLSRVLRAAPRVRGSVEDARSRRRRQLAQSGTFTGHRPYAVGDDLRLVDWNAYARTGGLFVKLLEEDERRTTVLLLDASPSMTAGEPQRWTGSLRLAAILGGLALVHLDGLTVVGRAGQSFSLAGSAALSDLLARLERLRMGAEEPADVARAALLRGATGKVHWISDFASPSAFVPALALLRRSGCRVVGWLPQIPADRGIDLGGWVQVFDPETGAEVRLQVDAALRTALHDELRLLRRHQEATFVNAGCSLQRFPLPVEGDFRMASWMEAAWSFRH